MTETQDSLDIDELIALRARAYANTYVFGKEDKKPRRIKTAAKKCKNQQR